MSGSVRRRVRLAARSDAGLGITEVLVALVVLAMVMAAATALFINTMRTSRDLDLRAFGVQLANEYLESIRAAGTAPLVTCPGTQTVPPSRLVAGRLTSAVQATWNGSQGDLVRPVLDETVPLSMANLTNCNPDAATGTFPVPVTYPDVVERNVTFRGYSFVGECFAPSASVTDAECLATRTSPNVRLYRVVMLVTWVQPDGPQSYWLSTLMDPVTGDPVYGPTAIDDGPSQPDDPDDPFVTYSNEPLQIGVGRLFSNDDFTPTFRYKTIQVKSVDGEGTAELRTSANCTGIPVADRSYGCVEFTPFVNLTGPGMFQYRLEGLTGDVSNWGTVTVNVLTPPPPVATDDGPFDLVRGQTGTYTVVANDTIWPYNGFANISVVSVSPEDQASRVTVVPAADPVDWAITYETEATYTRTTIITYRLTDSWSQYDDAVVTVNVTPPPGCTPGPDGPVTVSPGGSTGAVSVLANDTCPPGVTLNPATLTVTTPPTNGTASASGGTITYSGATLPGSYTVGYTVYDSLGRPLSSTLSITVVSPLVAQNDGTGGSPALSIRRGQNNTVTILANDTCPMANRPCRVWIVNATGGFVQMTDSSFQASGWALIVSTTRIRYLAGQSTGVFTITYRLVDRTNDAIISNDATVYVRVRN